MITGNYTPAEDIYWKDQSAKPLYSTHVLLTNEHTMEIERNSGKSHDEKKKQLLNEQLADLTSKVNIDQAAIDEARDAVGDDPEKIRAYLINNRGL